MRPGVPRQRYVPIMFAQLCRHLLDRCTVSYRKLEGRFYERDPSRPDTRGGHTYLQRPPSRRLISREVQSGMALSCVRWVHKLIIAGGLREWEWDYKVRSNPA